MLGCGTEGALPNSQSGRFFSTQISFKEEMSQMAKVTRTTRTTTTQVVPWSLADGRRQKRLKLETQNLGNVLGGPTVVIFLKISASRTFS